MLAARIFGHSVRQVVGNLGPALRVSIAPMALQYAVLFTAGGGILTDQGAMNAAIRAGQFPIGAFAAVLLTSLVTGTWMAVAWHRFVLRGEVPAGLIPAFHGERMLAYFGRSLFLGLALVGLELALGIPLLLASGIAGVIAKPLSAVVMIVGGIALICVLVTAFYRLSLMLPAAALGKESGLRMAWAVTKGQSATLFGLALIATLAFVLLSLPRALFAYLGLGIFAVASEVVAGWAAGLTLLSIFTTLYGHYVEKRALV